MQISYKRLCATKINISVCLYSRCTFGMSIRAVWAGVVRLATAYGGIRISTIKLWGGFWRTTRARSPRYANNHFMLSEGGFPRDTQSKEMRKCQIEIKKDLVRGVLDQVYLKVD